MTGKFIDNGEYCSNHKPKQYDFKNRPRHSFQDFEKPFFLTDMVKLKYRLSSFKIIQMYLL